MQVETLLFEESLPKNEPSKRRSLKAKNIHVKGHAGVNPLAGTTTPHLTYYGGPVVGKVKIITISIHLSSKSFTLM